MIVHLVLTLPVWQPRERNRLLKRIEMREAAECEGALSGPLERADDKYQKEKKENLAALVFDGSDNRHASRHLPKRHVLACRGSQDQGRSGAPQQLVGGDSANETREA
jgi:hypothetical protein